MHMYLGDISFIGVLKVAESINDEHFSFESTFDLPKSKMAAIDLSKYAANSNNLPQFPCIWLIFHI